MVVSKKVARKKKSASGKKKSTRKKSRASNKSLHSVESKPKPNKRNSRPAPPTGTISSSPQKIRATGSQSTGSVQALQKTQTRAEDGYDHLDDNEDESLMMSVGDHLEELRRRILAILAIVSVFSVAAGIFSPQIHQFLLEPFKTVTGQNLIMSKAYGGLLVLMKLSLLTGFMVALPFVIYILWGFVTPAVTRKTGIIGNLVVAVSSFLFWGGVLVCWLFIFPLSLKFLFVDTLLWGTDPIHPIEEYYGFLFMLHIGSGITFQLPLVLVILGALGIVTMDWHARFWKYILVGIFILAAILTPPDPVSQLVLGSLLCVMYAISVLIVYLIEKTRKRESV